MSKAHINLAFATMFILLLGVASAVQTAQVGSSTVVVTPSDTQFSLGGYLSHILGTQQFSVVGNSQACGINGNPNKEWSVNTASSQIIGKASALCSSGHGYFDVFTNGWTPWLEFSDSFSGADGVSCGNGPCNVQLYCCANPSPTTTTQCQNLNGQYSTLQTASCTSWKDGYQCTANGQTETSIPFADSSFKYCSTSIGVTCWYNSGSTCSYQKYPGLTACPSSYQGNQLYNNQGACQNSLSQTPSTSTGSTGSSSSGTSGNTGSSSSATVPVVNDPALPITIIDETFGNPDGSQLTGPAHPGDTIKINFKIRVDDATAWNSKGYVLEAGVIPGAVASSWFPSTFGQTYSVFNLFQVDQSNVPSAGCLGQPNIGSERITTGFQPLDGLKWIGGYDTTTQLYSGSVTVQVPSSTTVDLCPVNGQPTAYWNGTSPVYAVYFLAANDFRYKNGVATGYTKQKYILKELDVSLNSTSIGNGGASCSTDFDCQTGQICASQGGLLGFFQSKTCQNPAATSSGSGTGLSDLKKLSLTRGDISTATNDMLFASSCLTSSECLATTNNANYSVSCVNIASLRNDGTLSQIQSDSFFSHANSIVNGAITGAGVGLGLGVVACIGGNVLTATGALAEIGIPLAVVGCPALLSGGTTIGGAIAGGALANAIQPSDTLVQKLKADDANSVGICTATPSTGLSAGDILKYLPSITGNSTYDLIIYIVVVLLILMIIFGGGKK